MILLHFLLSLFSFLPSPTHHNITQTLCQRGSSTFIFLTKHSICVTCFTAQNSCLPRLPSLTLTGQAYGYPTQSHSYISTGPYWMLLASNVRHADRCCKRMWCDPISQGQSFAGKQPIKHNISVTLVPAVSASSYCLLSTLDILC